MKKVNMNDIIIGENIKKYAKMKNVTLHALADEINIGYTTMSYWCNGRRQIPAYSLFKISCALDVEMEKFMEGVNNWKR